MFVPMVLAFAGAACGDDGGSGTPDAPMIDAPPADTAPACTALMAMYGGLTFGSMNMRQSGDWVTTDQNNVTAFVLAARLPGSSMDNTAIDGMVITATKPTAGFTLNTPLSFDPSPTAQDPLASISIVADLNLTTMTAAQAFQGANGTLTLSAVGEANGNPTTGVVSAVNFREINQTTGADVPSGCTSMIMGMNFFLTEMNPAAIQPDGFSEGAFSQDEVRAMFEYVQRTRGK
jgi:hypothetical protein